MYINTVHFFSKPWGGENNPVRSSVSDQCYFYAKYDKNASTSIPANNGEPFRFRIGSVKSTQLFQLSVL